MIKQTLTDKQNKLYTDMPSNNFSQVSLWNFGKKSGDTIATNNSQKACPTIVYNASDSLKF